MLAQEELADDEMWASTHKAFHIRSVLFFHQHRYRHSDGFHPLSFEVPSPLGKFTKVTNVGQHTVTLVCEDR